jgi:hypothetical protein
MPKSPDLAIFVLTDRRTEPIALPLAHAHGVMNELLAFFFVMHYVHKCVQAIPPVRL